MSGVGPPVRVLYLMGLGRSGSTIIDRLLGQLSGVCSLGEVSKFWSHVVIANQRCGCGELFNDCAFWQKVASVDPGLFERSRAERIYPLHELQFRTRSMPRLVSMGGRRAIDSAFGPDYRQAVTALYRALDIASGGALLVDSSKNPVYASLLAGIPDISVSIVHLIRDPRAVAHSWTRQIVDPGSVPTRYMHRYPPAKSAAFWVTWNLACEGVARNAGVAHMALRYEDFVADPQGTVAALAKMAGVEPLAIDHADERTALLSTDHTVSGNPARFGIGARPIRLDDEWRSKLAVRDQALVSALSSVVAHRYGYSVTGPLRKRGQRRAGAP